MDQAIHLCMKWVLIMIGRSLISKLFALTLLVLTPAISYCQDYLGKADYPDQLTNDEIRELMIQMSIKAAGKCACPYSPDAINGICGTESLYYQPGHFNRPGGFKLYCFMRDISSEDVYFWKLKYATPRAR